MSLTWNNPRKFLVDEASRIVREIALDIEIGVKTEMLKPKSGRKYGSHIASAPGEAPAVDSQHYIKDIEVITEKDADRVVAFVGVKNTPYAVRLETTLNREVWRPQAKRAIRAFRSRSRRRRR